MQAPSQAPSLRTVDKADSTNGVVVFSISSSKPGFKHYYLDIVNPETKLKERFTISTYKNPDIKTDSMDVYYETMVLPSGEYRIYSWGMALNGMTTDTYLSTGSFSIPFTVTAGHVNYVGDFLAKNKLNKMMAWKYSTPGIFVLSDRFKTDFDLIRTKFPNLDLNNVMDAMPDLVGSNSKYSGIYQKGIHTP